MKYKIFAYFLMSAFTTIPQAQINVGNFTEEIVEEIITEENNEINDKTLEVTYNELSGVLPEDEIIFKEANETVWTICSVNIRKGPSADFEKITTLKQGYELNLIGIGDNGWNKVIYNGEVVYINAKYISSKKPEPINVVAFNENDYFIKKDGNVEDKYIITATNYYNKIPANVRNYLESNGMLMYVTDKNIAQTWFAGVYNSVMGVTLTSSKTIYIEDRENACVHATIHECGHVFDTLLIFKSDSDEFIALYEAEAANFTDTISSKTYEGQGCREYFAELFNQTILNPKRTQLMAPQSYNYMINLINSIK